MMQNESSLDDLQIANKDIGQKNGTVLYGDQTNQCKDKTQNLPTMFYLNPEEVANILS